VIRDADFAGTGASRVPVSRIAMRDLMRVAFDGLRSRRARTALAAVGIAIGVAALVGVLGIAGASRANLLSQLDALGTNLLTVTPGSKLFGGAATLPLDASAMIRRVGPVQATAETAPVTQPVYRTDQVPAGHTGGISVVAAQTNLLTTLHGALVDGAFLNGATARYPAVVLGATAAQTLGIARVVPGVQVDVGGRWFTVVGVLEPLALAPELDRAVLIGFPVAESVFGIDGSAGTVYVRMAPNQVLNVARVLAGTANPEHPEQVQVSRPSDVLAARAAASSAFTSLFLGLAAVALLVAGVGVANVMLMSVLERRSEIGLRRALGATRRHVALQFMGEAVLLATAGGALGVASGASAAGVFAMTRGWPVVVPPLAVGAGMGAALAIGVLASVYPAARATAVAPTEALRSP
jgi:putative ABC transport system permease protein